jgi:succinate dehydrogenase / fumarate reductase, cytochrome b subunit
MKSDGALVKAIAAPPVWSNGAKFPEGDPLRINRVGFMRALQAWWSLGRNRAPFVAIAWRGSEKRSMSNFDAGMTAARRPRPVSPHLQIYRFMLTYVMSGFHRVTGFVLYFGFVLIAWWLLAAASGPNAYANFEGFAGSIIGQIILFGYTWALIHHALGGIRHLVWDLIYGFDPAEREMLALATIIGSVVLTVLLWVVAFLALGGPR